MVNITSIQTRKKNEIAVDANRTKQQQMAFNILGVAVTTAVVVVLLALASASAHGLIPIHQHSLEPPLLVNYEESGLPFWTFGGNAVVTNDFVLMTPKVGPGHSYLWNRHPVELSNWAVNFTIRAAERSRFHLFGSNSACTNCGVAFWHVAAAQRHGTSSFFGIPPQFRGIGIVFPTGTNTLYVVHSDGRQQVAHVEQVAIGQCPFALDDTARVVMVAFDNGRLSVTYAPAERPSYTVPCVVGLNPTSVQSRFYFGFTALAVNAQNVGVEVQAMKTTGAISIDADAIERKHIKENLVFDPVDDKKNKLMWDGKPDEPQAPGKAPEKVPEKAPVPADGDAEAN